MWSLQKKKSKPTILKEFRERYRVKSLEDILFEKLPLSPIIIHGHCRDSRFDVFEREKLLSYKPQSRAKEIPEENATQKCAYSDISTNNGSSSLVEVNAFVPDDIYSEDEINTIDHLLVETNSNREDSLGDFNDIYYDTSNLFEPTHDNNASVKSDSAYASREHYDQNNERTSSIIGNAFQHLYNDFSCLEDEASYIYDSNVPVYDRVMVSSSAMSVEEDDDTVCSGTLSNNRSTLQKLSSDEPLKEDVYVTMLTTMKSACLHNFNKWNTKTPTDLKISLRTPQSACKDLQKKELIMCINAINNRNNKSSKIPTSWNKARLYECLLSLIKGEEILKPSQQNRRYNPPKLIQLVSRKLNCIPKETLAVLLSEDKWQSYHQQWMRESEVEMKVMIPNVCEDYRFFSKPLADINGSIRCHFTDCSHILTCLRTKICTTGIAGLNRNAWIMAAESDETLLNIAIVIECIDKQSVAFAKRVFGEDVEQFMIKHGFEKEANFIRLIRRWFEAEDEPGMEACERCSRRIELRDYLLSAVNFGRFPPYTQYIKGIPIVTFESLLTNIDRKILLFKLLPNNMYNVRALGTQEVEQFFSTVRDLDPSGLGTPKPDDIPSMIAAASLLDNTRMNPNRFLQIIVRICKCYQTMFREKLLCK